MSDLWGTDGLEQQIEYTAQQAVQNIEAIHKENKNVRREVDLLKA